MIFKGMKKDEALLRLMIRSVISEKKKPGGGITALGALNVVDPIEAERKIKAALEDQRGDVPEAADELEISPRQLYNRLNDTPGLEKLKDRLQDKKD
jgi:DNA-binding NtrC family response regulator